MSKKLTFSARAAAALTLIAANQSVSADIRPANNGTQVSKTGGVEIVQIATPSNAGLSHNKYNRYNVDKAGAVLNNSMTGGQSQLAGQVAKNPNLKQQSAKVILNEVVSRAPSKLAGKQEILGQKADYVLANPNGISCDGCGFINTPRASLVVGKAEVNNGKLTGYNVTGDKALTTNGNAASGVDRLDLIAPTVNISGNIKAKDSVDVVIGRNQIARDDKGNLSVKNAIQKGQVLDGKVFGSMQSNRIRIHSTDERATVHANGANLQASELVLSAGNANLSGVVTTQTKHHSQTYMRGDRVTVTETKHSDTQNVKATNVKADKLTVDVKDKLTLTGSNINAKTGAIVAGSVDISGLKTKNTSTQEVHQSKGLWKRSEVDTSSKEALHRTNLNVDHLALVATDGKLNGEAVNIKAKTLGLYGEQGITLSGAKTTNTESARADFKRESAKLRTGFALQESHQEAYHASQLDIGENLIVSGNGDVNFAGTRAKINGSAIMQNNGKVNFSAEQSQTRFNIQDNEKYWGGLAGAKSLGSTKNEVVQNGADFTVDKVLFIDAQNGVGLQGSRVIAGQNALVKGNQGDLVIDSVQATVTEENHNRLGTIFNITKERTHNYVHTSTAQGSTLKSQSNLVLTTDKDVNITGSQVGAGELLAIANLGNVNVKGAENHQSSTSSEVNVGLSARVNNATVHASMNSKTPLLIGHLASSATASANLANIGTNNKVVNIDGNVEYNPASVEKAENKVTAGFNVSASATLGVHKSDSSSQSTTYTGSNVSGGSVVVNTQALEVAGSAISAAVGDLNINANSISSLAQTATQDTNHRTTDAGLILTATATESGITGSASLGVKHNNTTTNTQIAQTSTLSANNNVNLTAESIRHQGSTVSGQNVVENAKHIQHDTAQSQASKTSKDVDVSATFTVGVNKDKLVNGSLALNAEGGRKQTQSTTHQGTQINATQDVNVNAHQLIDNATQYQAGNNVNLTSQEHQLNAVNNHTATNNVSGGVNAKLSANTKDFQTANVGVEVGAKFQLDKGESTQAQKAGINAENVNIQTGKLYSQADIYGKQNVSINATEGAHFAQASNSESQRGGFNTTVGVGALVVPAAGAAIPSIKVDVNVNGNRLDSTTAQGSQISGGNVAISSQGNVNLQNTEINATNANIVANKVDVSAGQNSQNSLAVNVGAGVSLGANLADAAIKGNLSVKHENSQTHTASNVNAENLHIQAQNGISLTGVSSNSKQLTLDSGKGDLNVLSANDKVKKTDVATSLALSGGVSEQAWTPAGGSASLDVNVVRNDTHTSTNLTSDNAQLNVGGNALFNASQLNANSVSGNIAGNSHSETASNKINEVSVSLSASGSGKFTAHPDDNWLAAAANDWNNGTIAGIKADAGIAVDSKREQTNSVAGVNTANNQLTVQGTTTQNAAPTESSKVVKFDVQATTNVKSKVDEQVNKIRSQVKTMLLRR
ncbi:hypothetical protein B0181_06605 [Moraxella caviae]|uniref:Hemolysin n=2 Tax=Moraxella caviae TaxID=34060 RepID=A0A1T0A1L8_9GAMM|nr:hemagglutinin repeat-containing protein [Moraxella caviae]OOR89633.1 hypothetical protein B0181_06605 [Moraxella caviae]STZ10320.1 Hemolysin precursor [Moraxella caviae]